MAQRKLTRAQRAALENLAHLRPSSWGLSGMSAMGGHTRVMVSLYKAGLVTLDHRTTDAGRDAVGIESPGVWKPIESPKGATTS